MTFSREEVEARDKADAANHEAAHVVVASLVGIDATAILFQWPGEDVVNLKTWGGRCWLAFPPDVRPDDQAVIAIAGEVAGLLDDEPDMLDFDAVDLIVNALPELSETDLSFLPADVDDWKPAIGRAHALLTANADLLAKAKAWLVDWNRVTSDGLRQPAPPSAR